MSSRSVIRNLLIGSAAAAAIAAGQSYDPLAAMDLTTAEAVPTTCTAAQMSAIYQDCLQQCEPTPANAIIECNDVQTRFQIVKCAALTEQCDNQPASNVVRQAQVSRLNEVCANANAFRMADVTLVFATAADVANSIAAQEQVDQLAYKAAGLGNATTSVPSGAPLRVKRGIYDNAGGDAFTSRRIPGASRPRQTAGSLYGSDSSGPGMKRPLQNATGDVDGMVVGLDFVNDAVGSNKPGMGIELDIVGGTRPIDIVGAPNGPDDNVMSNTDMPMDYIPVLNGNGNGVPISGGSNDVLDVIFGVGGGQPDFTGAGSGQPDLFGVGGGQPDIFGIGGGQPGLFGVGGGQPELYGIDDGKPDLFGVGGGQPGLFGVGGGQPDLYGVGVGQPDIFGVSGGQPDIFGVPSTSDGSYVGIGITTGVFGVDELHTGKESGNGKAIYDVTYGSGSGVGQFESYQVPSLAGFGNSKGIGSGNGKGSIGSETIGVNSGVPVRTSNFVGSDRSNPSNKPGSGQGVGAGFGSGVGISSGNGIRVGFGNGDGIGSGKGVGVGTGKGIGSGKGVGSGNGNGFRAGSGNGFGSYEVGTSPSGTGKENSKNWDSSKGKGTSAPTARKNVGSGKGDGKGKPGVKEYTWKGKKGSDESTDAPFDSTATSVVANGTGMKAYNSTKFHTNNTTRSKPNSVAKLAAPALSAVMVVALTAFFSF